MLSLPCLQLLAGRKHGTSAKIPDRFGSAPYRERSPEFRGLAGGRSGVLDSDVVTDFYDKSAAAHDKISGKLADLEDSDEVYISILSLYEFEYGLANAPDDKKGIGEKKIVEAQLDFGVLPLSVIGAKHFGVLKKELKDQRSLTKEGIKKHNIDLIIAATALAEDCTLISADAVYGDLRKSHTELKLENWLAPPSQPGES